MGALQRFIKRRDRANAPKNEFHDTAALMEERVAKMRDRAPNATIYSTAELIDSLAVFVKTLGVASASADRATKVIFWLTVVGIAVAFTNVALVVVQIVEADRASNAQNSIALNGQFYHDPINELIIEAVESHKPILVEHRGRITSTQLDNYLGDLDTIDATYNNKQITEDQLCGSYSTIVSETFKNPEIQKYLHDNPDYFGGAVELAGVVKNSKLEDCH